MIGRNCPNCGAVIDVEHNKCAYCGTSYFDLGCIPLNEPFYLKMNLGTADKPQIVTTKVFTTGVTATCKPYEYFSRESDGYLIPCRSVPPREYEFNFVESR